MRFSLFSALVALSPIASLAAPLLARQDNTTVSGNSTASGNSSVSSTTTGKAFGFASQNGGTTGGAGGTEVTVTSNEELLAEVEGDDPKIIWVEGTIEGYTDKVRVGSNKSIIGKNSEAHLIGIGLFIKEAKNVIIQNLAISKVSEGEGDAIGVQKSENIWIDHCDLSSDLDNGKDYYDGLADFSHQVDYVTVSNTYFHDHYKASLVGHSDSSTDDEGLLHITYANNHWKNINSRQPLLRFGTAHIYNSYYEGGGDSGINTRMGAQALVESNVFVDVKDALTSQFSKEDGYAVENDNDFGSSENSAPEGTLTTVPYEYELLGSENVKSAVVGTAGNTLNFA